MHYGYARVSTHAQDLASQREQLTAAGVAKVFEEKASGSKRDRTALARAIRQLEPGDVLMVTRLDRLARSTVDLLNILEAITKKGAGFKSLADAWADTTTPHGKLLVTMLGGMAEFERSLILARTSEGRRRAKAAGVKLGRTPSLNHFQRKEALERKAAGEPNGSIARSFDVSASTISRLKPELRA